MVFFVHVYMYSLSRKEAMAVLRELMKLTFLPISADLRMTSKLHCGYVVESTHTHNLNL